jgi:CHAD domain-containing protein
VVNVVQARLEVQLAALDQDLAAVRRGEPDGVHRARIDCRRLRSLLATFRPWFDRDVSEPLRDELRWLAGTLSDARDRHVVAELLLGMLADEPPELVAGPVASRVRRSLPVLAVEIDPERYAALRAWLERLAVEPEVDTSVRKRVRKEVKRVRRRYDAVAGAEQPDEALHDLRKAAKRLRYAAETWAPSGGKDAKRVKKAARRLTSHLGERQDTVVTRAQLVELAREAAAAGEPTFTYGRLHERETRRAADLDTALAEVWDRFTGPATRSTC